MARRSGWRCCTLLRLPCVLQTLAEHNWNFLILEAIHKGYLDISHNNKHGQLTEMTRDTKEMYLSRGNVSIISHKLRGEPNLLSHLRIYLDKS